MVCPLLPDGGLGMQMRPRTTVQISSMSSTSVATRSCTNGCIRRQLICVSCVNLCIVKDE
eukprot:353987-Chlamydomonas_euryale.AAC.5